MVVLGGMGSIPGVVLGAIILVVVPEVLREYAQYRFTIFGLGLTLMMLVRPEGLWPVRVRPSPPATEDTGLEPMPERTAPHVELLAGEGARPTAAGREGFLSIDGVGKSFGGLRAVNNVSFSVARGQLVAVIGPNGAGKTTLFNLITGVYPVTAGIIRFAGRELQGLPPHEVTALGVARTYQNIRLFRGMSVLDNVLVGAHCRTAANVFDAMLHTRRAGREERESRKHARALLDFFGIGKYESQLAMNLPYGDQRRLEIARALATRPTLLLLDEPAAGMNPAETIELIALTGRRALPRRGVPIVPGRVLRQPRRRGALQDDLPRRLRTSRGPGGRDRARGADRPGWAVVTTPTAISTSTATTRLPTCCYSGFVQTIRAPSTEACPRKAITVSLPEEFAFAPGLDEFTLRMPADIISRRPEARDRPALRHRLHLLRALRRRASLGSARRFQHGWLVPAWLLRPVGQAARRRELPARLHPGLRVRGLPHQRGTRA